MDRSTIAALPFLMAVGCGSRAEVVPRKDDVVSFADAFRAEPTAVPSSGQPTPSVDLLVPDDPRGGGAWSPDGKRIALDHGILDLSTLAVVPFECDDRTGRPLWGSPDRVLCNRYDGSVLIVDLNSGKRETLVDAHDATFVEGDRAILYQPLERDRRVIRDVAGGHVRGKPLPSPYEAIWRVSPDGAFAFSAAKEGVAAVIDLVSGKRTEVIKDASVHSVDFRYPFEVFSPDSTRVAMPRMHGGTWIIDVANAKTDGSLSSAGCDDAFNVAWSPDGKWLAVGTTQRRVCLFDVASRTLLRSWSVVDHHVSQVVTFLEFTPTGGGVVAGVDEPMGNAGNGYANLYRTSDGTDLGRLDVEAAGPLAGPPAVTARGTLLVTLAGEMASRRAVTADLHIEDLVGWKSAPPDGRGVVSPDGAFIAFDGGTIASNIGARPVTLQRGANALVGSVDPTSTKVMGTVDGAIRVWDAQTGALLFSH